MFSSGVLSSKTLVSIHSNIKKKKKFYIRILSIHFYFKPPTTRSNQTNELEVRVNNEDESKPDKCLTLYAY